MIWRQRKQSGRLKAAGMVLLIMAFGGSSIAGTLVLSGSSTMQKRILEPAQKALEKKTGVAIEIKGAETMRGIRDLMAGTADAAISDCPLALAFQETGAPSEGTYREHVVAQDRIVAIVNAHNRVKKLTREQLAGIHSGKITNWKEVGGADGHIAVVIPPPSSGTRAVIQDSLMDGAPFAANNHVTVTDREALDIVEKSPIAIALLSEGFARSGKGLKVVSIPPVKRQLCIITKNEPTEDLKKVIEFLQSKKAKRLFR
jgi:phosphate transport system substrate-binding protein